MALTMEKLGEFYATFFQGLLEESEVRATRITVDEHITGTGTTPAAFSTGLTDTVAYDVYISTAPGSVGNVYQCTLGGDEATALWRYKFTIPAGAAGDDGADAHVFFKYSAVMPTQDSDLTDHPSAYIGVYSGTAASAPATWNSYTWYQWRGNNTFVKWSSTEPSQDSDIQDTPGPYIGVYVGAAASAPTTYASYAWYCIKGENGNGLVIKDVKADYTTLLSEITSPAVGDAYAVGSSLPYTIYIYLASGWKSFGTLSAAAAGDISIVDIGGYFESTTAEGALQEAGAALLQKADSAVIESGYDPAATYALGEFCIHNGAFYECTTAIASPEVWNAAHWTERTIGYVLKALNDAKAALVSSPTEGHVLTTDENGQPQDSGYTTDDFLGGGAGLSLLANADWRTPINQRAATGAVSAAYCIDRWIGNGTVTPLAGNYITLTNATTMEQRLEILPAKLLSRDVMFSIMIGDAIQTAALTFPAAVTGSADSETLIGLSVAVGFHDYGSGNEKKLEDVSSRYVPYIKITASASINVQALKLEVGTASTLDGDTPINFSTELAKCMRYYQYQNSAIIGLAINPDWCPFGTPFGTVMRDTPTFVPVLFAIWSAASTNISGTTVYGTAKGVTQAGNPGALSANNQYYMTYRASADLQKLIRNFCWKWGCKRCCIKFWCA